MNGAGVPADAAKSIKELNSDLFEPEIDDRYQNPLEARKKAMDYLARREYGQRELEKKLTKAGYDPAVSMLAVKQLTLDGLQDDHRFVENFVQSRISRGKGPVRIHAELAQRDIASILVESVLEEFAVDWYDLAREVRRKKYGRSPPIDFKEKARQMRFLQYRGFQQDHLHAAFLDTDETA